MTDGVIHVNPTVIEETWEFFRYIHTITDTKEENVTDVFGVDDQITMHILDVILAQQHSIKKGIKLFGKTDRPAVTKNSTQMQNMEVCQAVHANELIKKHRIYHLFNTKSGQPC